MKEILTVYQGGQQLRVVQCLRCKEVFTAVMRQDELRPWDIVTALGEKHKGDCPNVD